MVMAAGQEGLPRRRRVRSAGEIRDSRDRIIRHCGPAARRRLRRLSHKATELQAEVDELRAEIDDLCHQLLHAPEDRRL